MEVAVPHSENDLTRWGEYSSAAHCVYVTMAPPCMANRASILFRGFRWKIGQKWARQTEWLIKVRQVQSFPSCHHHRHNFWPKIKISKYVNMINLLSCKPLSNLWVGEKVSRAFFLSARERESLSPRKQCLLTHKHVIIASVWLHIRRHCDFLGKLPF